MDLVIDGPWGDRVTFHDWTRPLPRPGELMSIGIDPGEDAPIEAKSLEGRVTDVEHEIEARSEARDDKNTRRMVTRVILDNPEEIE